MWMLYLVYPRSNQRCRRRYKPLWLLSLLCTMIFLWMRLLVFGVLFFHRFALKYSFVVWTSVESKPCVNSVRINGMDCDGNACATHCGHVYACIYTWFGWLVGLPCIFKCTQLAHILIRLFLVWIGYCVKIFLFWYVSTLLHIFKLFLGILRAVWNERTSDRACVRFVFFDQTSSKLILLQVILAK